MIVDLPSTTTAAVSKKLVAAAQRRRGDGPRPRAHPAHRRRRAATPTRPSRPPTTPAGSTPAASSPSSPATSAAPAGSTPRSGSAVTPAPARSSCSASTAPSPTTATASSSRCCCPTPPSSPGGRARRPGDVSADPIGAMAQRRITDAAEARNPHKAMQRRAATYQPGDTDLAWTRVTLWRGPARRGARPAAVRAGRPTPPSPAAATPPRPTCWPRWLAQTLQVPGHAGPGRRAGTGMVSVRLERRSGDIDLVRPDGVVATLSQPGQPVRRITPARGGSWPSAWPTSCAGSTPTRSTPRPSPRAWSRSGRSSMTATRGDRRGRGPLDRGGPQAVPPRGAQGPQPGQQRHGQRRPAARPDQRRGGQAGRVEQAGGPQGRYAGGRHEPSRDQRDGATAAHRLWRTQGPGDEGRGDEGCDQDDAARPGDEGRGQRRTGGEGSGDEGHGQEGQPATRRPRPRRRRRQGDGRRRREDRREGRGRRRRHGDHARTRKAAAGTAGRLVTRGAPGPGVVVHRDKQLLADAAAARLVTALVDAQASRGRAHVVLTGGSMGSAILASLGRSPARDAIDWRQLDVWWGDERFLPAGDPERNETQARAALLDAVPPRPGAGAPDAGAGRARRPGRRRRGGPLRPELADAAGRGRATSRRSTCSCSASAPTRTSPRSSPSTRRCTSASASTVARARRARSRRRSGSR